MPVSRGREPDENPARPAGRRLRLLRDRRHRGSPADFGRSRRPAPASVRAPAAAAGHADKGRAQNELFHPAVATWFAGAFPAPSLAQADAWPAIKAGRHTLIAAPTGSGKTLAAFLAAIDDLVRQGLDGTLADATQVVYVSPLKALS